MRLRYAVLGLLAGLSLVAAADETSPSPQASAIDAASATSAEPAAPAESTSAPTDDVASMNGEGDAKAAHAAEASAESGAGEGSSDPAPPDAAAAAMDIETEKTQAFDPDKAKPSEIAAYNATAEPDDRVVCKRDRESAGVGARFSQKVCRTVRQWRELSKR